MALAEGEELPTIVRHEEFGDAVLVEDPTQARPMLSTRTANFLVSFSLACMAFLALAGTGKWIRDGGFVHLPEKADWGELMNKMNIEIEVEPAPMVNRHAGCANDPESLRQFVLRFDGCEPEDKGTVGTGNCSPSVCQTVRDVMQLQDPNVGTPEHYGELGLGGHHRLCARGTATWIFCPKTCANYEKCPNLFTKADATGI